MATARWFFQPHVPESNYVLQEQVRQDLWRSGPATAWVDVTQTAPQCKAAGYWHETSFELEWVPRDYVILRASQYEKDLVRSFALQLGFRPFVEREENGGSVVEWYLHPTSKTAEAEGEGEALRPEEQEVRPD